MFKKFLQIRPHKYTEALGSNWRSADDLVLGTKNLLFPLSARSPVYSYNIKREMSVCVTEFCNLKCSPVTI
jgi:hypothetical protein